MTRTTLAAAALLAAIALAGCHGGKPGTYSRSNPPAAPSTPATPAPGDPADPGTGTPEDPDRVRTSRNAACASTSDLECMNHFAFGWHDHPDYSDGKIYGALTSLNPYANEHSQPPAVSGTYSGEVFGYLLSDGFRANRINGTVTMEYRHAAERLDINFRFPGNEYYNEDFESVELRSDCGDSANYTSCFGHRNVVSYHSYNRGIPQSASVNGLFYGPESQEFGGLFWKHGPRYPNLTGTLESAFGVARQ